MAGGSLYWEADTDFSLLACRSTSFVNSSTISSCTRLPFVRQSIFTTTCSSRPSSRSIRLPTDILTFLRSGKQRVSKRDPAINPLVIEKVGKVGKRVIWQLDDSPRLYAVSNPFKRETHWRALSTSLGSYQTYIASLTEPEKIDSTLAGPFKKAKTDAQKARARSKGKGSVKLDEQTCDQATRQALEQRLPMVLAAEQVGSHLLFVVSMSLTTRLVIRLSKRSRRRRPGRPIERQPRTRASLSN